MKEIPADFDVQAYGRGCTLQQCEMLSRLAEIGMRLAEAAGARALAAEAPEASPPDAPAEAPQAQPPAGDPGLAFARYAHLVRQTLAQRARAVRDLCARDGGRDDRRARHRDQVEDAIDRLVWAGDRSRAATLEPQVSEALADLYRDQEDPVEDRPVGSVVAGLVCGLGLAGDWRRQTPRCGKGPPPARPDGSPEEIRAERARRRTAVTAVIEWAMDELAPPDRAADIKAGLAIRMQEPDVETLLDTVSIGTATIRLCRSLGFDIWSDADRYLDDNDDEAPLDSS